MYRTLYFYITQYIPIPGIGRYYFKEDTFDFPGIRDPYVRV